MEHESQAAIAAPTSAKSLATSGLSGIHELLGRTIVLVSGLWESTILPPSYAPTDMSSTALSINSIYRASVPEAVFEASAFLKEKISNFAFFRADLNFNLKINAQPFQQGKLMMLFRPFSNAQANRELTKNHLSGLSGYPHVVVDASSAVDGKLTIPFMHQYPVMNMTQDYERNLGELVIVPINSLDTATLPTSCTYTVFFNFTNIIATVPSDMPNTYPSLPIPADLPVAQVDDSAPVLQRPGSMYVHDGHASSVNLALHQSTRVSKVRDMPDEMQISAIANRPNLLKNIVFTTANTVGQSLGTFPVTPSTGHFSTIFFPTLLCYVSTFFSFWRGTMRYTFTVSKTAFHSGRIRISYNAPAVKPADVTSLANTQAPSIIWDLRDTNSITFDVPFASGTPAKPCEMTNVDSGLTNSAIGYVALDVVNPLLGNDNVADSIPINVWVSSPDIAFYGAGGHQMVTPEYRVPLPADPPSESLPRAQILADASECDESVTPILSMSVPPFDITSEKVTHLSDIVKRATVCYGSQSTATRLSNTFFGLPGETNSVLAGTSRCLLDRLSYIYAFYSGGVDFKFVFRVTEDANLLAYASGTMGLDVNHLYGNTSTPTEPIFADRTTFVKAALNPVLEVTNPFFSNAHRQVCNGATSTLTLYTSRIDVGFLGSGAPFYTLKSGSPDFQFEFLIGAPSFRFVNT